MRNGRLVEAVVEADAQLLPVERFPTRIARFPPLDLSTLRIKLSRGECYGDCPVYDVEIDGSGRVKWHGYYYTAMTGERRSTISRAAVHKLVDKFKAANFFALDAEYRAMVTDNPDYQLTFSTSGHSKVVTDYVGHEVGMPRVVKQLEDAVDTVAGTERWVTGNRETVELLKAEGFDFGSKRAGRMLVAATKYPNFLRALLAAGAGRAEGLTRDRPLQKALSVATSAGRREAAALLLGAGADPNGTDSNGETLLELVSDPVLARQLIAAGADPNHPNTSGEIPMLINRDEEITRLLIHVTRPGIANPAVAAALQARAEANAWPNVLAELRRLKR